MQKKGLSIIKLLALVNLTVSFSLALSPIDEKPTEDIQIEPISQVAEEAEVEPVGLVILEDKEEKKQQNITSEKYSQNLKNVRKVTEEDKAYLTKVNNLVIAEKAYEKAQKIGILEPVYNQDKIKEYADANWKIFFSRVIIAITLFFIAVAAVWVKYFFSRKKRSKKDNEIEKNHLKDASKFVTYIFVFVWFLILFFSAPYLVKSFLPSIKFEYIEKLGAIGDMFGSLNAFFSGLTVIGVFTAIYLQRKELKETRKQLELQKEEFIKQNETLKLQQFENTFFQLLNNYNNFIENLTISGQKDIKGRQCLMIIFEEWSSTHDSELNSYDYLKIYKNRFSTFEHIYGVLYSTLNYIEISSDIKDKEKYVGFVKAQTSPPELELLKEYKNSSFIISPFKLLLNKYNFCEISNSEKIISEMKQFKPRIGAL